MTATLRARWLEFSDEQAAAYIVLCVSTAPREPATLALVEVVCDAAGLTIISEASTSSAKTRSTAVRSAIGICGTSGMRSPRPRRRKPKV
jgi:hypothetical protein